MRRLLRPGTTPCSYFRVPTPDSLRERNFCAAPIAPIGEFSNLTYLLPGQRYTRKAQVSLPDDITGSYYLGVYSDNRGSACGRCGYGPAKPCDVVERNETNNYYFSGAFFIQLSDQPDLQVQDVSYSSIAATGYPFTVRWTDRNNGAGLTDAGNWTDEVYLSRNRIGGITSGDILLGTLRRTGAVLPPQAADSSLVLASQIAARDFGTYYPKVRTDVVGEIGDISEFGFESNNVTVGDDSVSVVLSPTPDLVPGPVTVTAPIAASPGHEIFVRWTVVDSTSAPVLFPHRWEDALYLSADTTFDSTDALLGSFPHSAILGPNQQYSIPTYSQTRPVRLPNSTPEGGVSIIARSDRGDDVFEFVAGHDAEANNNRSSSQLQITALRTDLALEVQHDPDALVPDSANVGQSIPLAWRVTNTGKETTPVSSWTDAVYFSPDSLLDNNDILLVREGHAGTLSPAATYTIRRDGNTPYVVPGRHFIIFTTDFYNQVYEQSAGEANNTTAVAIHIRSALPDLVVTSAVGPDQAASGDSVVVSWIVRNDGSLATNAASWVDRVYLSRIAKRTDASLLLGTRSREGRLTSQAEYSTSASFQLPLDLSGVFQLVVVTDEQDVVFESSEENNSRAHGMLVEVDLTAPGNLGVDSVTAPSTVLSGQVLTVTWLGANRGMGQTNSASWFDAVYLSRDEFLDSQDGFLGEIRHDGVLPPSGTYVAGGDFDLPLERVGSYFVLVRVDVRNQVFEALQENDNVHSAGTLTSVEIPAPCDLVVTSASTTGDTLLAGDPCLLRWTVQNMASSPCSGRWFDVLYFSADSLLDAGDRAIEIAAQSQGPAEVLMPGQAVSLEANLRVPGLLPGEYFLLAQTDARNHILETSESNNFAKGATTIYLDIQRIAFGETYVDTEATSLTDRYYALSTPASETVRIEARAREVQSLALYVRKGAVPKPGLFDFYGDRASDSLFAVHIPTTDFDTYCTVARSVGTPAGGIALTEYSTRPSP